MSVEFCLKELADNFARDGLIGMRIGLSVLTTVGEKYLVIDWNGNESTHDNLFDAVREFISVQSE